MVPSLTAAYIQLCFGQCYPTLLLSSWKLLLRCLWSLSFLPDAQQGADVFPAGRVTFQSSSGQPLPRLGLAPLPADCTVQDSLSPQCLGPSTLLWSVRLWLGRRRGRLDEKPVILLWHLALHFLYANIKNTISQLTNYLAKVNSWTKSSR